MKTRRCSECNRTFPESEFQWTHDRYGIPWRKVCFDCAPKVQDAITMFVFDPSAAGEHLEPDDY